MIAGNRTKTRSSSIRRVLIRGLYLFLAAFVSLEIYLATPLAAAQLSRLLTSTLHQPVRVTDLRIAGGTMYLKGVALTNPPGFPAGNLASVGSIAIAPAWGDLLHGRRSIRLIALEGVRLDLRRNSQGEWNFAGLRRSLAGGKSAGRELLIKELLVKDGAVLVNGQGVAGISLQLFDLASKGSTDARLALAFADAAHNEYRVEGSVRPGNEPALDLALMVNNRDWLHAVSKVSSLQGERYFSVELAIDELDLAKLAELMPAPERRKLEVTGRLSGKGIRFTGNASRGVTSAAGTLQLQDCSIAKAGRLIFSGLSGTVNLARTSAGLRASGRLTQRHSRDKSLLETLDAPFAVTLSPRLQPLKAEIAPLSASIMGLPVTGRLGFRAGAAEPFTVSLQSPPTPVARVNPQLEKFGLQLTVGSVVLSLDGAGRGAEQFRGTLRARLAAVEGRRSKTSFGVNSGVATAKIKRVAGQFSAAGSTELAGLVVDGKAGEARFSWRLGEGMVVISDGICRLAGTRVSIVRLAARLPVKEASRGTTRYPLAVELAGGEIEQGGVELQGLAGSLHGSYAADPAGRWLEGTAGLTAEKVYWQGTALGAPAIQLELARTEGRGELSGTLLGGKLTGAFSFHPLALAEGGKFQLGIADAQLVTASGLLPKRWGGTLTAGLFDGSWDGGYSRSAGLAGQFTAKGKGLAVTGRGGKSLFYGGGFTLAGSIDGQRLKLNEARLTVGDVVTMTVQGELTNPLSSQRQGQLAIALPATPVNTLLDPFINGLPPFLQEATVAGSLAAIATLDLHAGRALLDGSLLFKEVHLEVPAQKLTVADLNGSLPFSLDLAGGTTGTPREAVSFSRDNYPRLLAQLSQGAHGGQTVTVGKVSFGPLELGSLTMQVAAGNGITKLTALHSSLYQGTVFGKGYLAVQEGLTYRVDLLINDLSLQQFCSALPKIKGYIAGRLDGVVSLGGAGKAVAGLAGFTDLWTRQGAGERLVVSKEFLQRLSGKKLSGFFFRSDRPYDQAEIKANLEQGYLTFETLDIVHTNVFGVRDLSVSIAPSQNRIAIDHLFEAIKQAAVRGKAVTGEEPPTEAPTGQEFKWQE